MRHLFVRKLHLWPRFHATVHGSLEKCKAEVIEIHVGLTPGMSSMQTNLLSLISLCVKELKQCNPHLDVDEITVENAITKSFEKVIKWQLEPIWHQLTKKTKQLVADLRVLNDLMNSLTQCDCVSFYNLIHSLRASEKTFQESHWMFLEAAQSLYIQAKERVFGSEKSTDEKAKSKEMQLEENPKWLAVKEILTEIKPEEPSSTNVLILAQDETTCKQLREYLCEGSRSLLSRIFNKTAVIRGNVAGKSEFCKPNERKVEDDEITLTQMYGEEKKSDEPDVLLEGCRTFIEPFKTVADPFHVKRLLENLQPDVVVMYDANVAAIRELEVYKANNLEKCIKFYFVIFTGSVEEQRYLTALRKEKEAFEMLIKEKATMMVPEDREGKLSDHPDLTRDPRPANMTVNAPNTRQGGVIAESNEKRKVLVDMREFNSELPALIHRRGIDVVPLTLEVGDYILTPEICVERKSVSDLIGSLNNGRLYNQATAMTRTYRRPILLIEFDPNKPFTLYGRGYISNDANSQDVASKLVLLTLHFPQLRILWCASPYATAEMFDELKTGKPEPEVEKALHISSANESDTANSQESYNSVSHDFLARLPGINTKNRFSILNKIENISHLARLSEPEINELIQHPANSRALWESFHLPVDQLASSSKEKSKPKSCVGSKWRKKRK